MSGYIAEFTAPDGTTATVGSDRIAAPDIPDEHSVKNEYRFEIRPGDTDLEAFRHGRVELYFEADDGERRLIQSGPIDAIHTDDSGVTRVRGKDDLQRLSQTGPEGTIIADGEAADEIERVWGLTPFDADVIKPEPRPVADGRVIQDGDLSEVFSGLPDTAPLAVEDGDLVPLQSNFVFEGEDDTGTFVTSDDDYSDGSATGFGGSFVAVGDKVEYNFTTDYDIDSWGLYLRTEYIPDDETDDFVVLPEITVRIAGGETTEIGDGASFSPQSIDWEFFVSDGEFSGDVTLEQGQFQTLEIEVTKAEVDFSERDEDDYGRFIIDVVSIRNERFAYNSDNQVHEPEGYLDGPEEIAPSVQAVADTVDVPNSITAAELTALLDTEIPDELAIEFGPDPEADFTADVVGTDTETLSGENPGDLVSDIRAAVTLGPTDATRDTQTPRTGFEPQRLTSWELAVDEVSIIVFNEREFSGSWYQILQEMHAEGNLIFNNVPTEGDGLQAETFEQGALVDSAEWTRLGFERGFENLTEYANVLTAVGGEDDSGERPIVTVQDDDEIARVGDEAPTYRLFENYTTERGLLNRAQAALRSLTNDQLAGTVDIVPRRLKPGYAYTVDAFGGDQVVLVRQQFADGKQPSGSLEFEQRRDVSTAISGVRRETRSGEQ